MNLSGLFDAYGRVARLCPGLIAAFPAVVVAYAWYPKTHEWLLGLTPIAIGLGLVVALAHFTRHQGQRAQEHLKREWDGLPTTQMLSWSDSRIDSDTKQRYHTRLQQLVPGWRAPDASTEVADPEQTNQRYASAVDWLRENTRDRSRHELVFQENVSYGFRRNLFALRPLGLTLSIAALGAAMFPAWPPWESFHSWSGPEILSTLAVFAMVAAWIFVFTKAWVHAAAVSYARALLGAIDRL